MKKTILMLAVAITLANSASAINLGKLKVPGTKPTTPSSSGAVDTVTNVKTPHEEIIADIMKLLQKEYTAESTWFKTGDVQGIVKLVSAKYGKGKAASGNGHEWYVKPNGEDNCAYFAIEPYRGEERTKFWSTSNKPCE